MHFVMPRTWRFDERSYVTLDNAHAFGLSQCPSQDGMETCYGRWC